MLRVRSSRRAAGLKPADYDHEIDLENRDETRPQSPDGGGGGGEALGGAAGEGRGAAAPGLGGEAAAGLRDASSSPTQRQQRRESREQRRESREQRRESRGQQHESREQQQQQQQQTDPGLGAPPPDAHLRPFIDVQAPTPEAFHQAPARPREPRESAIDILYENERGGFLCGSALFSSKALGCLDPPPWTNAYHKASPTSIHTAQVPDPSWEWTWPEWRVNRQDGVDDGGWEYSFAFSKAFSWHGAKWWNSFVRRRAWTRKRAQMQQQRDGDGGDAAEPSMLNTDYFTVRPASYPHRLSMGSSLGGARAPSRSSMSQSQEGEGGGRASASNAGEAGDGDEDDDGDGEQRPADIEDMETLLQTLRLARIDREKGEAVDNYVDHATDLEALQGEIHAIMALFVFQASRRQLLGRLMGKRDEAAAELARRRRAGEAEAAALGPLARRKAALDGAARHAAEEVRRLAFWSDVRQMARDGELPAGSPPESERGGWHDAHQSPGAASGASRRGGKGGG